MVTTPTGTRSQSNYRQSNQPRRAAGPAGTSGQRDNRRPVGSCPALRAGPPAGKSIPVSPWCPACLQDGKGGWFLWLQKYSDDGRLFPRLGQRGVPDKPRFPMSKQPDLKAMNFSRGDCPRFSTCKSLSKAHGIGESIPPARWKPAGFEALGNTLARQR